MTHQELHDVTEVKPLEGYRLWVSFDDGTSGVVDFSEWEPFPGVLGQLTDQDVFQKVFVHPEHKTLAWPTPQPVDADPIWLYCRANGLPFPVWD
jgi:Protein of unknown function (DUF2442)